MLDAGTAVCTWQFLGLRTGVGIRVQNQNHGVTSTFLDLADLDHECEISWWYAVLVILCHPRTWHRTVGEGDRQTKTGFNNKLLTAERQAGHLNVDSRDLCCLKIASKKQLWLHEEKKILAAKRRKP